MRFNLHLRCISLSGHTLAVAPNPRFHRTFARTGLWLATPDLLLLYFAADSCLFFFFLILGGASSPSDCALFLRAHHHLPTMAQGSSAESAELGVDIVGPLQEEATRLDLVATPLCWHWVLERSIDPTWYALATTPRHTPHMQTAATNFPWLLSADTQQQEVKSQVHIKTSRPHSTEIIYSSQWSFISGEVKIAAAAVHTTDSTRSHIPGIKTELTIYIWI